MTTITITLNRSYEVQIDNQLPVTCSSFAKLIAFISNYEADSIGFEFQTLDGADKYHKTFVRRLVKLAKELGFEILFIENKEIDGFVFPNHFVGALG